jgi:murein DD-endopeptidase MepM/ murein hydrolase activator NlpD
VEDERQQDGGDPAAEDGTPDAVTEDTTATSTSISTSTATPALNASPTPNATAAAATPTEAARVSSTAPPRGGPWFFAPRVRWAAALSLGGTGLGLLLFVLVRAGHRHAEAASATLTAAKIPEVTETLDVADGGDAGELTDASPALVFDAAPPPRPPLWRIASLSNDKTVAYTEGPVGKRPLVAALGAAGLPRVEVQRVLHSFSGVKNLNHCNPKDTFAFAKDKQSGHVMAFEYASSPVDVWQAKEEAGVLEAKKLDLAIEERRVAVGVAVGDDLRASLVQAGLDDDMLKMLDDALDGHAELSDLRPGARLRIVATEERIESQFARYSDLGAVEYTPASPEASPLRVYYFRHDSGEGTHAKAGGFYDVKAQQPSHGGWRSPVPLARIASRFNPKRMHPVLHVIMPHNGVDFAAPVGTPVYASASGTVKSAGDAGPCGNMVQIEHTGGLVSCYCHMSRFAAGLHAGQHVEARQIVGYVGQTGRATGPHLHFAIKRGEVFIDPLALRLDGVRVVPASQRDEFTKIRTEMDAALDAIALPPPVAGAAVKGAEEKGESGKPEEAVFDDSPGLE